MRDYFGGVGGYAHLFSQKIDCLSGIAVGIVWFLMAYGLGFGETTTVRGALVITLGTLVFGGYHVYRDEHRVRADLENLVRVEAEIGSQSINVPLPELGHWSLKVQVLWEVWVDPSLDVSANEMGLNIILYYRRRWWEFLRKQRTKTIGLHRADAESTRYRERFYGSAIQPTSTETWFSYYGHVEKDVERFQTVFVLKTGAPYREHRIPVKVDLDKMRERSDTKPL